MTNIKKDSELNKMLESIFIEATDKLEKIYPDGILRWLQYYNMDLYEKIEEVENELNTVWKKCSEGEALISTFQQAVQNFYDIHLKAITIYKIL